MRSSSRRRSDLWRRWALLAAVLMALCLHGCATESDGVMPWATPQPGEGSILPGSLLRQ
jgi:hypothetical protein